MEKVNSWEEKKFVGNMAENVVSFLIKSMPEWKCIPFGVENHIEDLKKIIVKELNPTTKRIKSMPDFVAFNTITGETFFIEAKYRGFVDKRTPGKVEYQLDFLNDYLEYWKGTKLIILHNQEPYFYIINLEEVKPNMCRKEQVSPTKWDYYWDFAKIQKGIKDLFPTISDSSIQKAVEMIPKK